MDKITIDEASYLFIADWYESNKIVIDRVPEVLHEYDYEYVQSAGPAINWHCLWESETSCVFKMGGTFDNGLFRNFKFRAHFDYSMQSWERAKLLLQQMLDIDVPIQPESTDGFRVIKFGIGIEPVKDGVEFTGAQHKFAELVAHMHCYIMYFMANFEQELVEYQEKKIEKKPAKKKRGKKPQKVRATSVQVIRIQKYIHDVKTGKKTMKRHYTKCTHSFGVKGHYRHYNNGKVVWIAPYQKNSKKNGQKKSKEYRFNLNGKNTK